MSLLGTFAKLGKATIIFAVSVGLPVFSSARTPAWNNSTPTERIFMKFDIRIFFEKKSVEKIQVL